MLSPFKLALKYVSYWITSSSGRGHGIHSPFVFEFVQKVLNDTTQYPEYKLVEQLRSRLEADPTPVPYEDFGAGSIDTSLSKSVSAITKKSAKNAKYGQLLFRIARYYKPQYVVELGTSLGISTAYLGQADKTSVVVSGEGNYVLASMAVGNMKSVGLHNVRIITGNFDNTLPQIVSGIPQVDLAFIDGNHRKQPTINYFNELLKRKAESSVFIIDDIYWSEGMESAWQTIKAHPSVMLSIDLFFIGIIFFRPEFKVKQHFRIRF